MGRKRTQGSAVGAGAVALALLALVALASCPNPIDDALLRLVEDDIPPELTITEPVGNTLYGATVEVNGTLFDSALVAGDRQGRLRTLTLSIPTESLQSTATFDASGAFTVTGDDLSFDFDSGTGEFSFEFETVLLGGGAMALAFTAVDANGNTSERALTLLEDPSGPYVNLSSPTNLSNYDITVNLTGTVTNASGDPATNDVRLIRWECLQDLTRNGSWEAPNTSAGVSYEPATGDFSAGFSTIGLSGTIAVRLYADDFAGHRTEVNVQLLDNRPGPAIEIQAWPSLYSSSVTTSVAVSGRVQNADIDWTQFAYQAYGASGFTSGVITTHSPELIGTPPFQVPTGYDLFSFSFNPKISGITGLLTIKVQATDTSGSRDSEKSVTVADDPVKPTFSSSSLAADNSYLDITFSEAVYTNSNGTGALVPGDFSLSFSRNGGSATGASISGVSMTAADTARLTLSISGTPSGQETITVTPAGNSSVYDALGNAMAGTQSTGAVTLHDELAPTISPAACSVASDNSYLEVVCSEGVYTNSGGSGDLVAGDFALDFQQNGGTATGAALAGVTRVSASTWRLNLTITGTPDGNETVEATPATGTSIYDASGNAMADTQTTGEQNLNP